MASTPWTTDEIEFLLLHLNNLAPVEIYQRYVTTFGTRRSYDSVQKQCRRLQLASWSDTETIEEVLAPQEIHPVIIGLDDIAPLPGPQNLRAQALEKKRYEEEITDFISALANVSEGVTFSRTESPVQNGSSLCILLSDTHFGKHTRYFNMEEAGRRIASICQKIRELNIPDLNEVVLMLAGDMTEGEDIYPTQSHHIETSAIRQVNAAVDAFWNLAVTIRRELDVLVRFETCPGNHGRVSRTASEETNWDNIIYQILGLVARAHGDENLIVNVNFQSFCTFNVKGKTGMLFHHGTKHTGTPAMQIRLVGWMQTKQWDFMCHGHWHQWEVGTQFGNPVIKNGSLPGEDDLAERMGVFDPPRQAWLLVREGQPINQLGFFQWENTEDEQA